MPGLFILQVAIAGGLFGLIWTIQLVHYPAFALVDGERWSEFHRFHTRRITCIVFPLMFGELLLSGYLLVTSELAIPRLIATLIPSLQWLLTGFIFIPLHRRLEAGQNPPLIKSLVRWNFLRTALWTLELALLLWAARSL